MTDPYTAGRSWAANSLRYAQTYATWRRVPGGRVLHAFYDGSDVPLCGIRPMRADGQLTRWRPSGGCKREHKICWDLARQEKDRRLRALVEQQREEMAGG